MAIIKCKMCGGDLELSADKTFGVCDHCGSMMTFPKIDDEQRAAAFNRGNHFRRIGEFDKALAVYERIVREDENDAEAHWCCALCRFGIEYVEDPATLEWLPTCHRASFDSFLEDVDYLAALEHSDGLTRRQYQKDANKIAEVQRGILATSQNAEPYDVFICYKEKDDRGVRTDDSTLAQDIYYHLKEQGRRVFYARVTMDHIAGTQFEPYIFAALNSAKVMLVIGTKSEYLNAVWVKNEWSRFLALMKKDQSRLLLPCYRDMDPYDMPAQLAMLHSYDMSKLGFMQDLDSVISRMLDADKKPEIVKETVIINNTPANNIEPMLKRAFIFIEDGEIGRADELLEQVLSMEPECARAYIGKLMIQLKVNIQDNLKNCAQPFDDNKYYQKAVRFADEPLKQTLKGYIDYINTRNTNDRLETAYRTACSSMNAAKTVDAYKETAALFSKIEEYKDAKDLAHKCLISAETIRKDNILAAGISAMKKDTVQGYSEGIQYFSGILGWRNADQLIADCKRKIDEINAAEAKRLQDTYDEANSLEYRGETAKAAILFGKLGDYSDAAERSFRLWDQIAQRKTMSTCVGGVIAIKTDGSAMSTKYSLRNRNLSEFVAVDADGLSIVGLQKDGTVACNYDGLMPYSAVQAIEKWKDIVAIAVSSGHVIGLKKDGTCVAAGKNEHKECDLSNHWTDVVAIYATYMYSACIRADGSAIVRTGGIEYLWENVVSIGLENDTVFLGKNGDVMFVYKDVRGEYFSKKEWCDVKKIDKGRRYTVGLKHDGTVLIAGDMHDGRKKVTGWKDIVDICAGDWHIVGLKKDGTVVTAGLNYSGQCKTKHWRDVVAISANEDYTAGLKRDGTIVVAGGSFGEKVDVSNWTDLKLPTK